VRRAYLLSRHNKTTSSRIQITMMGSVGRSSPTSQPSSGFKIDVHKQSETCISTNNRKNMFDGNSRGGSFGGLQSVQTLGIINALKTGDPTLDTMVAMLYLWHQTCPQFFCRKHKEAAAAPSESSLIQADISQSSVNDGQSACTCIALTGGRVNSNTDGRPISNYGDKMRG
jgi:hypothetical protein